MSTSRFFGIIFFSASLYAQFSSSNLSITGELRSHGNAVMSDFLVEVYDVRSNTVVERAPVSHGQFELDHVPAGGFSVRLLAAPGEPPIVEQYYQFAPGGAPLILDLPERAGSKPISGVVSLRELEHPIPKKALKEAYEGQQLSLANDVPKAIAKLENAIRIAPSYRDAHVNLGVQYARVGRIADALCEFQKALDIGPPAAPIYADLALTSAKLKQFREAEAFARKALELEPENSTAQRVLQYTSQR